MQSAQIEISKARQSLLGQAFRAGKAAAFKNLESKKYEYDFQIPNTFAGRDGGMPASSFGGPAMIVQCAQWHAFVSGVCAGYKKIKDAGTCMGNARFVMRRAIDLGRE